MSAYRDAVTPHWRTDELKVSLGKAERRVERLEQEQQSLKEQLSRLQRELRLLRSDRGWDCK